MLYKPVHVVCWDYTFITDAALLIVNNSNLYIHILPHIRYRISQSRVVGGGDTVFLVKLLMAA